jgi:hypothetical protein
MWPKSKPKAIPAFRPKCSGTQTTLPSVDDDETSMVTPFRSPPSVSTITQVRGVARYGANETSAPAGPLGAIQKPPRSLRGYRVEDCRARKVSGTASRGRVRSCPLVRPWAPSANRFSRPSWRYLRRHSLLPLAAISRYRPRPSNSL